MKAAIGPGTTFGNYRVDSLLGRGGMGVVYLATDESLERPVALKLIAPELVQNEQFRARFLREPKLAASLDHPNVIPIYEAGEHQGQLYLAMRYVKGTDLRAYSSARGSSRPNARSRSSRRWRAHSTPPTSAGSSIDRNGDLTPAAVPIMRMTAKDRVLDRVVRTPRNLIR
jgi:serine/threonine protein kinase